MQQTDPLKKVITFNIGTLHEKNLEEHIVIIVYVQIRSKYKKWSGPPK
jgi:hypothetical protein